MKTIVAAEIISAVFLAILLLTRVAEHMGTKSNRYLNRCLLLILCTLAVDAMSYSFMDGSTPFAFRYAVCLLAYLGEGVCFLGFSYYSEAFIAEKTRISPWVFRILRIAEVIWIAATAAAFIAGEMVVFENGVEVSDSGYPVWLSVWQIAILLYTPAVALYYRKELGSEAILLLSLFNLAPILGILTAVFAYYDYSYIFGAVVLVFITEFLQKKRTEEERQERQEQENRLKEAEEAGKLIENVAAVYRFAFAVDMSGSFFRIIRMDDEVKRALGVSGFDSYEEAIRPLYGLLHSEDRERMARELDFGTIREKLKDTLSYNIEYRVLHDGAVEWHEMNVTRIAHDEVAMGFGEKDLEITKRHIDKVRFGEYFGLYEADLDTGMLKVIINSPYYTFSETGKPVPYTPAMTKFAESQTGVTKEFFLKLADPEWVREALSTDDRHSFTYFSVTAGNTWVDVTSYVTTRHSDGTPAMFALAYSFISTTEAARHDMQKRLNESTQIISSLAGGYVTLYYVNMDEEEFSAYNLDGEKYPISDRILREGRDPFEMLHAFGESGIVHPDDRHLFAGLSAEIFRQRLEGQKRFSVRFRKTEGDSYVWYEMDVVKSEAPGERANAIVIGFTDCDEEIRKEMEQQERLENALAMAEVANRAKTDFLFNMSHDIRTPMNAIIGFTNMAKKEIGDPEKALDSLGKVQRSSDILLNLINDVLDMSRIESGKTELHEEGYDFYHAFDNIEPAMASLAATKDISLAFSIGEVRDRYVFADGSRFDRVMINIISNAIKYTPSEGSVRVSADQLADTEPGYGNYRFTVADSGIGMSEEFQKHMFEDFSREENSTTRGIQGTGLGLPLAKKLVEIMGGTISCVSKQGVGTTFTVVFPFRLQTDEDLAEKAVVSRELAETDLRGKRALLVEDNELNREIGVDLLTEAGVLTETASDGQKAVSMVCERGADHYDFILMDIQMPVMNGYEATRAIRKQVPELKAPIIALSANAFAEDRQRSLEAGMNDHVAKPIDMAELIGTLSRFL